jgi:superfamily II DNA or RNA helicase
MDHEVHLRFVDESYIQVIAERSILFELSDSFTFFAENYKFSPKYKSRVWDGKIRLINNMNGVVYAGLASAIKKEAERRGYTVSFDNELYYDNVSEKELLSFIDTLNIPTKFEQREYQTQSILKCIRSRRRTLVSPTSSGKSLMIYVISQWYRDHKCLIIVPTIGLVKQMANDFISYGYKGKLHLSTDGLSKSDNIDADIVITTWQSLDNGKTKMHKDWYEQFGVVFGDEAHGAKAKTLISILTSLKNCKYRFGTTGTLDGNTLNELTIQGLFGPKFKAVTTKELMEQGFVSQLQIKCIVLKYPELIAKSVVTQKNRTYADEVKFLVNYEQRNKFIKNLALSLEGNKLVFFRMRDHGQILKDLITNESQHNVFYIDGTISSAEREDMRHAIEDENNAVLIASLGTTSTGVSINKLHHMIAASPSKSKIKVLQSIGRMLRMHDEKTHAILYDIVDDLSYKSKNNFTLDHFFDRIDMYDAEGFEYKIYNVGLK